MPDLFDESDKTQGGQLTIGLGGSGGFYVVTAGFLGKQKFSWDLFAGYDSLRVLTYSASVKAVVRMLDKYSYTNFECVFGYEGVLGDFKTILSFQNVVVGKTREAIMELKDDQHRQILEKVHAGKAHFYVARKQIVHAKLYLLSSADGSTRVITGSANLSERAFSGDQSETLVKFDNDEGAWRHYNGVFDEIKDAATDEIPLPTERISKAEIVISEAPVMDAASPTLVIESLPAEQMEITVPMQIQRVEKVAAALGPSISAALPPIRSGKQRITPEIKREISRIHLVKSVEEANSRYFSLNRVNQSALLSGEPFPLEWHDAKVSTDATVWLNYFKNYEGAFEGDVPRLQRDYFILMAWLYFSPFMCDMRSLALLRDSDVIRFPSFAIVFGKSNCGKTDLVDTLMTSMFGYAHTIDKQSFTVSKLRGLQQAYKRFPVVFDDIGPAAFGHHGKDMIKDEMQPRVSEYPGFVLSMNAEPLSVPDEVVKRSLMIYTTTALPPYNEEVRQRLESKVRQMRSRLTGHLFRRYLVEIMDHLEDERLPGDWLWLSSRVLSSIISGTTDGSPPHWCQPITWLSYAEKRYDRIKARLDNLLRPSAYARNEGKVPNGWTIEDDKVIVWEQRDAFGRVAFEWKDVPSTLINQEASGGERMVLHRASIEGFLGRRLDKPRWSWEFWG